MNIPNPEAVMAGFKARIAATRPTRWVRFGLVSLIFLLWVIWLQNYWVLLWWLLLFDIYITGYIPFTWWKKSKSAVTRTVMAWVDAIIYALVLVYFVFTFVGQNYQIPSSSLEKSLLTGDYLWVNKMAYGPRVPQTPVHFPLVQNTLPLIGTKSYLETPQWTYHRLKGYTSIKQGDIVVFNFPAGDSVAMKMQNPDLYTLSRQIGEQMMSAGMAPLVGDTALIHRDSLARAYGMAFIRSNPADFGEVISRPVDRRENYVKRAVGLPGQKFEIIGGEIFTDGTQMPAPENAQFNYNFSHRNWDAMSPGQRDAFWDDLGVAVADRTDAPAAYPPGVPLTAAMVARLRSNPLVEDIKRVEQFPQLLYPLSLAGFNGWTLDDYGPLTIPAKGMTIPLTEENFAIYAHAINHYEPHTVRWVNGRACVDGKPADDYTFAMDYYFMMGDNRHNSLDSRYWGFVPEDHIVGRPEVVLISFDPDRKGFLGIRWGRILMNAQTGHPASLAILVLILLLIVAAVSTPFIIKKFKNRDKK